MRRLTLGIALLLGVRLQAEDPVRRGNTFDLVFRDGSGEMEWISPSSFRFLRAWAPLERGRKPITTAAVEVRAAERGSKFVFETQYLTVEAEKSGARLKVTGDSFASVTEIRREDGRVVVDRPLGSHERIYGLGGREARSLDLHGSVIETKNAFLISSAGYGEFYPGPGTYRFDLGSAAAGRRSVAVPAERLEYFFYYGPTPRGILEEHLKATGAPRDLDSLDFDIRRPSTGRPADGSWQSLRATVYALQHASLSAELAPSFELSRYDSASGALFARAAQFGVFVPVLYGARPAEARIPVLEAMERRRRSLVPFFESYTEEARERGLPLIRPLAMQFPDDAEAFQHSGEFMLGDELLVAPVLVPAANVSLYLPQGIWTDWRTDAIYKGRQRVTVRAPKDELPLFVRNGAILPLAAEGKGGVIELHYFPKLGAEFFLYEESVADYSQLHAAPAGEYLRLEIESKVDRVYEWAVHHLRPCRKVESGGTEYASVPNANRLAPGTWFYSEALKSIRVRVRARAGGDEIVNVSF